MKTAILIASLAATQPLAVPFDFENDQIFVKVGIGSAPPLWFNLDSGAGGCVVDKDTARRLHLKTEGSARGTGAGHGSYEVRFAPDVTYRVGGTSLTVAKSYVIDLSGQKAIQGRPIAGLLGYDFFARYGVALDFETHIMTLYEPADTPKTGTFIPFTLDKHTPHIQARIKAGPGDAVERTLLVDSGSADAVDDDAFSGAPDKLEIVSGVGLGQEFRSTIGRAQWAEIGPFRVSAPLGATGGTALVGLEVLRRFDLVFDYAHSGLYLAPNRDIAEPFAMDASGLDLRWSDDLKRFVVHDVAKDTPAAQAGLKAGDEIAAIDGAPAASLRIGQVQHLLTKDGREVTLGLRDGRKVTLRLIKRL